MSASANYQIGIAGLLGAPGALRVTGVPIVARKPYERASEIDRAAAIRSGLSVHVLQPLPRRATRSAPFVYFEEAEFRVRIIQLVALQMSDLDAYSLVDDVCDALHWQRVPGFVQPLKLAHRVTELVEDEFARVIDVILTGAYQLHGAAVPAAEFELGGLSAMADLQAAVVAQLALGLEDSGVPIIGARDKDLGSRIEQAGHPLSVKVRPPLPTRAMQGNDEVFFEAAEVRVCITELPALNVLPIDAYDVIETVALSLHWQRFAGLLGHPLQIETTPTAVKEDPEGSKREIDVIFKATFGRLAA